MAEFNGSEPLATSYWRSHELKGVIADPFMGGGTPIIEANRLGFHVVGADINPMAHWIVRQSLSRLNLSEFISAADDVAKDVDMQIGDLYRTKCVICGESARVKYFLWVKALECPECGTENRLFPGHLLAESVRHPRNVVVCSECGRLNEYEGIPRKGKPSVCGGCGHSVVVDGCAHAGRVRCKGCGTEYRYPPIDAAVPLEHRMWAIEYHCERCKPTHKGRFLKQPDAEDLSLFQRAEGRMADTKDLPIPENEIPRGDETDRLHRWGYRRYRQMFNDRQLLGLGLLLRRIGEVSNESVRHALLTVFSDSLRYQNLLCRYDTYALKCQDIFSVHGFPVGLVQCENNILGIPKVGAGSFRHFVEKYVRAKEYCEAPFETRNNGHGKKVEFIAGERIGARFVSRLPCVGDEERAALIHCGPADEVELPPASLDGVFTDPPYFDNVQYAELIDFCYVWLRLGLQEEFTQFRGVTTRSRDELTGNSTLGRGLEEFTEGLSRVFQRFAGALKPGAPFVFTYHHNDPSAYVPLVVAILDAGMTCTATLPAAAEMKASLHIAGTSSSILDSVFVCRANAGRPIDEDWSASLGIDAAAMQAAGVRVSRGDLKCLAAGHVARLATNRLQGSWSLVAPLADRMRCARECLVELARELRLDEVIERILDAPDSAGGGRRSPSAQTI